MPFPPPLSFPKCQQLPTASTSTCPCTRSTQHTAAAGVEEAKLVAWDLRLRVKDQEPIVLSEFFRVPKAEAGRLSAEAGRSLRTVPVRLWLGSTTGSMTGMLMVSGGFWLRFRTVLSCEQEHGVRTASDDRGGGGGTRMLKHSR